MITNKDISIDSENGKITLNGNKYDLGTQGEIDTAIKDIYSVMGQNGAKNLIIYPYYDTTKTANGITFTDNGDGTVTVNGTATGNVNFWCIRYEEDFIYPEGKYILSDGGVGNSNVSLFLANYNDSTWKRQYEVKGNGEIAVTVQHSGDYNRTPIGINVKPGTTVNNLTFKPMLRLAADTDNTYRPYAKTNKQLTEVIDGIRPSVGNLAGEVLTLSGTQDNALVFNETGNDDNKGMIVNDKDGNERYRLYFTGGHVKFLSKAADGTTIVDTTLA